MFVADVNPVYSVTSVVRCMEPVNDRVMWTAEYNGQLCIRALPKGTPIKDLQGRDGTYCTSLLYVEHEECVLAGFQDGYLHVYNARTTDLMQEKMQHGGGVNCMTVLEKSVFTGGADWKVCQWCCSGGNITLERTLHGHRGGVRCFGIYEGPTGAVLFSGSDDGTIRAWDPYITATEMDPDIHTFHGHDRAVLSIAVVSYANQLWSGGEDLTVRVWDMETLSEIATLRGGHTAPVSSLLVVESRIWSADKHGHILLWDITTRSPLQDISSRIPTWGTAQGMILSMKRVQPTSAWKVWTASSNGTLQCWTAETVPVVFDEAPVARGMHRSSGNGVAALTNGEAHRASVASSNERAAVMQQGTTEVPTSTSEMQDYIESLQEELRECKRDAKTMYERYRLEVQRELEAQQLLIQENDRLRRRVHELEEMAGVPHDTRAMPVAAITNAKPRESGTRSPSNSRRSENELKRLREALDDAQAQLNDALQREQLRESRESSAVATSSTGNAQPDPTRQFVRQDNIVKTTSVGTYTRNSSPESSSEPVTSTLYTADQQSGAGNGDVVHTVLRRTFNGSNWRYLMKEKPHELRNTFQAESCAGLCVSPTQIEDIKFSPGGLVTELKVQHPASVSAEELNRRMQNYRFPALMKMHAEAFATPKTNLDAAEVQIAQLQQQLSDAQESRKVAAVTRPDTPNSTARERATKETSVNGHTAEEELREANARLRKELDDHRDTVRRLQGIIAAKDAQLGSPEAVTTPRHSSRLYSSVERSPIADSSNPPPVLEGTAIKLEEPNRPNSNSSTPRSHCFMEVADTSETPSDVMLTPQQESVQKKAQRINSIDQLREDYDALNRYVQEQLKPLISQLKRERGELLVDKQRLQEQISEESKVAATQETQTRITPLQSVNGESHSSPKKTASKDATPAESPTATEDIQQLREDHEALNQYLHGQLKPLISKLKRAKGELQVDLNRSQQAVQEAYSMYDEAAAALNEAKVREEKMNEAMDTLKSTLEAEQHRNAEVLSGRATQPTVLEDGVETKGGAVKDGEQQERSPVETPTGSSVDRLVAQNLELSLRLSDAEAVIAELRKSLDQSVAQMEAQKMETDRLLARIGTYEAARSTPTPSIH